MVENKTNRPSRFSRPLRQVGLRAEDVRQFSRVFIISDPHAAQAILAVGLTDKDIRGLQETEALSRRKAVRSATNYLTDAEVETIFKIKD